MIPCPPHERLAQILEDGVPTADFAPIEQHVESCPACQSALVRLQQTTGVKDWQRRLEDVTETQDFVAAAPPEALTRIDGFEIRKKLGSGAMGTVYLAYDSQLRRNVALKVVNPELAAQPGFLSYFEREARSAAGVSSDFVVKILHVAVAAEGYRLPFLVMELIEGECLKDRMTRRGRLPVREAAGIAFQVALGLAATHAQGIVHRDIKPTNIMLDRKSRRAKITDFGLARTMEPDAEKLTRTGGTPGSPAYMSPEHFDAPELVDGRSDIFSLGIVLYELLTGSLPFRAPTIEAVARQIKDHAPEPPRKIDARIPRDLETICLVCLDKDPRHRFPDASALAKDLRRFLKHEPIVCRRPGLRRRASLFVRRNRVPVWLSAAFLAIAVFGAAWSLNALSGANRRASDSAKEALARKQREQRVRYIADVKDAWKAWGSNRPGEMRSLLDRHLPEPNSGMPDVRGVEWYYLDRLLVTGFRSLDFDGKARSARFSPDGAWLAVSGVSNGDNCVKIWSMPSCRLERTLTLGRETGLLEHEPPVGLAGRQEVAFSPDSTLIAATCAILHPRRREGVVKVWEAGTGRELFSPKEPGIGGRAIAFSPDGDLIAGGYNLSALIWQLPAGPLRQTLPAYDPASPYPHMIAAAPTPGARGSGPSLEQLRFTPGGSVLTRTDGKFNADCPWPPPGLGRASSRAVEASLPAAVSADDEIAFSARGLWVIGKAPTPDSIRLFHPYDANHARPPKSLNSLMTRRFEPLLINIPQGEIESAAISNRAVALGERNGQVTLVKLHPDSGAALDRIALHGHHGETAGLCFSQDETLLVAIGDRAVTLWNVAARPETQLFGRPAPELAALQEKDGPAAFTRDGGWGYRIDSGGPQPSAKPAVSFAFYDMAQPKLPPRHVQSPVAAFSAFALSPDGSRFAIAGDDPFGRNAMVRFMASGRKGAPAPVASDLAPEIPIHVLDVATGKEVRRLSGHVHQPVTLMFDRTGHMLLSASLLEKTVRLWDVEQGKELRQFGGHEAGVRRAELSPDGRWIVSGDEKGVIKTWATQAAEPVDIFHFGRGHPVWAFHGALLAMLTDDKGVGVWDLSTRQWTANLGDPGRRIEALEFIDDGKRLTSLDRDGLTVWSIDPPESIISIPAEAWLATDLPRINATLQTLKPDR